MSRVLSTPVVLVLCLSASLRGAAPESFTPNHAFVTDYFNDRIVELDRTGAFVRAFGVGEVDGPEGIAFGPDGLLYVSNGDSDEVTVFDPAGLVVAHVTNASLDQPCGLVFGPQGHLFVSSPLNDRIVRFDSDRNHVGEISHPDLLFPAQLLIGSDGHLLCAGASTTAVFEFDLGGALVRKIGNGTFDNPVGLAFGPGGVLRVSDAAGDEVRMFDSDGDVGAAATGAPLDAPTYLAGGPNYANYAACFDSNRVVQFLGTVATRELGADAGLSGPVGVAFAPFRIKVKLDGRISGGAEPSAFSQKAMLSIAPGSNRIMLEFLNHTSGGNHYASAFGSKYAVLHGLEGVTSADQVERLYHGREHHAPAFERDGASITLRVKGKIVGSEEYFEPRKLSGNFDVAVGYTQLQARISLPK